MAPHLLVQRVQELLPSRGSRKRCPVKQRPAKSPVIQQSFRRPVKRHAHAIQQIDDRRRFVTHPFHQRLVRQKIAAIYRVVEMFRGAIAFALFILRRVDSALRTHRVRPLHRHDRKQLHWHARLGDTNRRHQPSQTSTHDNYFRLSHLV